MSCARSAASKAASLTWSQLSLPCVVQPEREPTDIEEEVARALFELQEQERDLPEMRRYLRDLQFLSAREVDVTANKKAIIIMVPHRLLSTFHKLQVCRRSRRLRCGVTRARDRCEPYNASKRSDLRRRARWRDAACPRRANV